MARVVASPSAKLLPSDVLVAAVVATWPGGWAAVLFGESALMVPWFHLWNNVMVLAWLLAKVLLMWRVSEELVREIEIKAQQTVKRDFLSWKTMSTWTLYRHKVFYYMPPPPGHRSNSSWHLLLGWTQLSSTRRIPLSLHQHPYLIFLSPSGGPLVLHSNILHNAVTLNHPENTGEVLWGCGRGKAFLKLVSSFQQFARAVSVFWCTPHIHP